MAERPVLYRSQERVARITLNRPDSGNRIDDILAPALRDACRRAVEDDEASVVLVDAAGDTFCVGAAPLTAQGRDLPAALGLRRVADALAAIPKPVIAVLKGAVVGQGLELALAADLRIASRDAWFAMDQIARGGLPWDGGTQRLPRLAPRGTAMEMLLTGRRIDAEEALQIGLAGQLAAPEELDREAAALAQHLASLAPIACAYIKEAVHKGMEMPLDQGVRLEADLAILLHTSADRAEGIGAFLERRRASFTGR